MLPEFSDYAILLAALPAQYSSIQTSTLRTYTIGPFAAEAEGQLFFDKDYVLDIWELLDIAAKEIRYYSYELEQDGKRIWWYDPQEHPNDPTLASTHPHHKHIHPDIKHNRVPAPGLSFTEPNLPFLIQEVERLLDAEE